jgi:hypothetical protein
MSEADRNARLDALGKATDAYLQKQVKEATDKLATARRILKGRTGQERLATSTVEATSTVLVDEIDSFLLT